MRVVSKLLKSFVADKGGATAIEYGLIVGLIFLVIISSVTQLGEVLNVLYLLVSAMVGAA